MSMTVAPRMVPSSTRLLTVTLSILVLAGSSSLAFAQQNTATRVTVTAPGGDVATIGLSAAVAREGLRLALAAPQTASRASWPGRHPILLGTMIGAGTGLALSRTQMFGGYDRDPRLALAGAGVGAWAGLAVSAIQDRRAGRKVSPGRKIGILAGAAAIVVVPLITCYAAGGCGAS